MCRSIRPLFNFEPPATDDEVRAAATQFVRKVSGYTRPSRAKQMAFDQAVDEIANATFKMFAAMETAGPPKDREIEAARAKARSAARFGA